MKQEPLTWTNTKFSALAWKLGNVKPRFVAEVGVKGLGRGSDRGGGASGNLDETEAQVLAGGK